MAQIEPKKESVRPPWSSDPQSSWLPAPPAAMPAPSTRLLHLLSSIQIGVAAIVTVLVLVTPYIDYSYQSGYLDMNGNTYYVPKSFAVSWTEDGSTVLLTLVIVGLLAVIAFAGYMWGWKASPGAAGYGKLTLALGFVQLALGIVAALDVHAIVTSYGDSTGFGIESWSLDAAAYAVLLGGIAFIGLGIAAVLHTRSSQRQPLTAR